ncbi:NUDIX hydrolase [Promicromonospora iranensis]|uniref:ADP-ribose pyrophosphatase YjhB (NUDIX family) n=1 Tax=Promicromonospora iranensis TaxID=1105144 RepID=A0ABU2CSW0_9MICO|nr:NUDIX hydrolase [Promicromonospora iranensis]MDR7384424.1 ADP-ribose pyrophosphatase YjhB (NUDIX family) [Promicromonospora iranensis]
MDPRADAAALVADRYPEARWSLLAGSVLDPGSRTAGSDLDIVVCVPDDAVGHRDSVRWRGWPVELFVNTEAGHRWFIAQETARRKPTLARMIAMGVPLAGEGDVGALKAECQALVDAGPGPASDTALEDARYGVTDLLDDLAYARDSGEADVVRSVLWERVGHLALAAAGRWDGGGKWLLRELRAWDPGYAARWVAARHDDRTMVAVARATLDAAGGPLFEGYLRQAPVVDEVPAASTVPPVVVRRTARAILLDDAGRLVLIKRTVPGRAPYWVTPGGGVEPEDASVEDGLHRELLEELGATAQIVRQVFLTSQPKDAGIAVQHYFLAHVTSMDLTLRCGPELQEPVRGTYDVERVDLRDDAALARLELVPAALKAFVRTNRDALLAEAASS